METMVTLKPAFKRKGVITAGDPSPLNTRASYIMHISR
ncbi:MAG: hypothetical protein ACFFD2_03835 [Promethearchaeota archaeon]